MKHILKIIFCSFLIVLFVYNFTNFEFVEAKSFISEPSFEIVVNEKKYIIDNSQDRTIILTKLQRDFLGNKLIALKMSEMGFNSEEILKYVFPYMYSKICDIEKLVCRPAADAYISVIKNTGKISLNKSQNGTYLEKSCLFDDIFYNIINDNKKIINTTMRVSYSNTQIDDLCKYNYLKSSFKTSFENSVENRKNNIRIALKALDGVIINPQKSISFNQIVGERLESRGYMPAKIISRGKFVESVGGGVCQVSTTLYNASLLAGLEILEVHPHSLKVNYIEPAFDAMINSGGSDLKIKNNTEKPIIIATSYNNDECLINIYGVENDNEIIRKYVFEEFDGDYVEGMKQVSPGMIAYSSLLVYQDNNLIEERFLRKVKYNPIYMETN